MIYATLAGWVSSDSAKSSSPALSGLRKITIPLFTEPSVFQNSFFILIRHSQACIKIPKQCLAYIECSKRYAVADGEGLSCQSRLTGTGRKDTHRKPLLPHLTGSWSCTLAFIISLSIYLIMNILSISLCVGEGRAWRLFWHFWIKGKPCGNAKCAWERRDGVC